MFLKRLFGFKSKAADVPSVTEPEVLADAGLAERSQDPELPSPLPSQSASALISEHEYRTISDDKDRVTPEPVARGESVLTLQQPAKVEDSVPEDSAPSKKSGGFFSALKRSREGLLQSFRGLFAGKSFAEQREVLEEVMLGADLGVKTTEKLLSRLKPGFTEEQLREELRATLLQIFQSEAQPIVPIDSTGPIVVAFVGVNGVGKTTTIGKLAAQYARSGAKVLVAACDTFRAGAVEQLRLWAERGEVAIEQGGEGEKPSTVAYRAAQRAVVERFDILLVDTAGRLHNRVNLMNELSSVLENLKRHIPSAPHETLLVIDGATGQNGLQQAREFHNRAKLTGLVVTKLDGTPKGGIVVAIKEEIGIPVRYLGVGEGIGDLRDFDPGEFVDALLSERPTSGDPSDGRDSLGSMSSRRAARANHRES